VKVVEAFVNVRIFTALATQHILKTIKCPCMTADDYRERILNFRVRRGRQRKAKVGRMQSAREDDINRRW
jgi:hypothetical protein